MSDEGRVGILISGRGSNMLALVDAMLAGQIPARPAIVISNRPDAPGLAAAAARGVATAVVDQRLIRPRAAHEQAMIDLLREHRVDLVCLAGYMRLLTARMIQAFPGRILNIHPSLLPSFPGLDAQRQALEYGVKLSGCTVHFVDEQTDHGPIVLQAAVPLKSDDSDASLSARILEQEHRLYPEAVKFFFQNRLVLDGRRVRVDTAR